MAWTEGFDKWIATAVGATGLAVAVSSFLADNANRRMETYKAFRFAVEAQNKELRDLYDDYLATFTPEFEAQPVLRQQKRAALTVLAQQNLGGFPEYAVPDAVKVVEQARLKQLQAALVAALTNPETGGTQEAETNGKIAFDAVSAKAAAKNMPDDGSMLTKQMSSGDVSPLPSADQVLTSGSASGWDIDLFWCRRTTPSAAAQNYAAVRSLGAGLADAALKARVIAPGVKLGQIRLKPLGETSRKRIGIDRSLVVYDNGPGEQEAAEAVMQLINGDQKDLDARFALGRSTGDPTRWRISVFACRPGTTNGA